MSTIAVTDARPLFTKKLVAVYRQLITPTDFLRSFFRVVETPTKEVSIEVQRGFEKVAVDVTRGTEGNRNSFSKSTEKIFVPPVYREYFDITQLTLYDRLFGSTEIDGAILGALIQDAAAKLKMLQDKIERALEIQCSQVFQTGIVTFSQQTNVDFKRKSASLVDLGGGNYWDGGSVDPVTSLQTACNWLRTVGKATGGTFDAILGDTALLTLLNNTNVQNRAKLFSYALDQITTPQRLAAGQSFHGEISVGSYRVRLWTYPQFYDDPTTGVSTPYIDPKKVILIPENPNFMLAFGAVPQLVDINGGVMPVAGAYVTGEYIDQRATAHILDIKSAPIAVPVAVDQIYTMKVLA